MMNIRRETISIYEVIEDVDLLDDYFKQRQFDAVTGIVSFRNEALSNNETVTKKYDVSIIKKASMLSNLEPSLLLPSKVTAFLFMLRGYNGLSDDYIEFIVDTLFDECKSILEIRSKATFTKIVKHLLTGSEVINNLDLFTKILGASILDEAIETKLEYLSIYAEMLKLPSARKLSELFNFTLPKFSSTEIRSGIISFGNGGRLITKGESY